MGGYEDQLIYDGYLYILRSGKVLSRQPPDAPTVDKLNPAGGQIFKAQSEVMPSIDGGSKY